MRIVSILMLSAASLSLVACASVREQAREAVVGPSLAPISYPALQASQGVAVPVAGGGGMLQPAAYVQPQPAQSLPVQRAAMATSPSLAGASANSLWRPGARAFFIDQRATRIGDILTVLIEIDDKAQLSNTTGASRTSGTTGGVAHFFGLEGALSRIFPNGYDPAHMIDQSGQTTSTGTGSVARQEKISLTIAAVVTGVLPNGNLMIQGRQQVKTNNELRDLQIAGIVRPEDISSSNTIRHTQIAEARIAYGGKGDLSRVQRTPAGQALMEQFSPF